MEINIPEGGGSISKEDNRQPFFDAAFIKETRQSLRDWLEGKDESGGGSKKKNKNNEDAEKKVKKLIGEKQYDQAFDEMYNDYGELNVVDKKYFNIDFIDKEPEKGAGAVTDPKGIDGKNLITFDSKQWDKVVTGERSYGWLTRAVYHEFVHVMQYQGLFRMKILPGGMSEFQANYLSVMNNNLPCYSQAETNFYAGKALGY